VQCRLLGQQYELEEGVTCGEIHPTTLQFCSPALFGPLVPFGKKATNKLWLNKIVFDTDCEDVRNCIVCLDEEISQFFTAHFSCVPGVRFFNASKLFHRGAMWANGDHDFNDY
jgi:hypothetical protein